MKTRYKFLRQSGKTIKSQNGDQKWKIGEWVKCDQKLDMCEVGLHCSKSIYDAFSFVQGEVVAKVEVRGKSIIEDNKEVWSEMRIIEAKKWDKKASVSLAIYSAELVLKNFEKEYPNDLRPRQAIEAAKKVLFKDTAKNRSAAHSARSAADSAAYSARSAAYSARSAADSARSAAYSEAYSALIKKIQKFMNKQYESLEEIK